VAAEAHQHAHHAAGQADQQEFDHIHGRHLVLRQAQAAQHGAGIEVAQHEAARRHGHGHGRQHGRQQADERQETVGAVQVDCICGLPDSSDSMRTPLMACALIWLSSQA
jgi:hypothetical protein